MNESFVQRIAAEIEEIKAAGLFKSERIIESPQGPEIIVNGKSVLNFCRVPANRDYCELIDINKENVTIAPKKNLDYLIQFSPIFERYKEKYDIDDKKIIYYIKSELNDVWLEDAQTQYNNFYEGTKSFSNVKI
jgi:hypothetical protein